MAVLLQHGPVLFSRWIHIRLLTSGVPAAAGMCVSRVQKVRGVEFSYQPPPRNVVPYAAALKGENTK